MSMKRKSLEPARNLPLRDTSGDHFHHENVRDPLLLRNLTWEYEKTKPNKRFMKFKRWNYHGLAPRDEAMKEVFKVINAQRKRNPKDNDRYLRRVKFIHSMTPEEREKALDRQINKWGKNKNVGSISENSGTSNTTMGDFDTIARLKTQLQKKQDELKVLRVFADVKANKKATTNKYNWCKDYYQGVYDMRKNQRAAPTKEDFKKLSREISKLRADVKRGGPSAPRKTRVRLTEDQKKARALEKLGRANERARKKLAKEDAKEYRFQMGKKRTLTDAQKRAMSEALKEYRKLSPTQKAERKAAKAAAKEARKADRPKRSLTKEQLDKMRAGRLRAYNRKGGKANRETRRAARRQFFSDARDAQDATSRLVMV